MRTFVLGDLHGNYKALVQCLERSNFDLENDRLIFLGDVVDGYPDTDLCIDKLLTIKNMYAILGNHDAWAIEWFESNGTWRQPLWTKQGGLSTLLCYSKYEYGLPPQSHKDFFYNMYPYITQGDNHEIVFTHGGFDCNQKDLSKQDKDHLMWDRVLINSAWKKSFQNPNYLFAEKKEIYIGHTHTQFLNGKADPLFLCNVIALDTGAGYDGKLTILDIETKQYWQSDLADDLYPGIQVRK